MKNWEKPPLVMAGLVLGLLALGNLLEGYGTYVRYCLGLVALVFWIFLIKGILKNKKESRKELSNPLIASVFTTFFMAGMILSTYILLFRSFMGSSSVKRCMVVVIYCVNHSYGYFFMKIFETLFDG